tara:strand:+ start:254 stop:805 length:552 start_codon:yes stop_codon:yes gene_type:complete
MRNALSALAIPAHLPIMQDRADRALMHARPNPESLMRRIPICLLLFLTTSPAMAADLDGLAWMSGHWRSAEDGTISEEIWTDGAGGLMLGSNRTVRGDQAVAFEFLRIETDGTQTRYCAQPAGAAATCFAMTDHGEGRVRFENPEHDFPQAIEYQRDGDALTATVSDLSGAHSLSFDWRRVPE